MKRKRQVLVERTYDGWTDKSFKLPQEAQWPRLMMNYRWLGFLDIQLTEEWLKFRSLFEEGLHISQFEPEDRHTFYRHWIISSQLWVFGGYECLRELKKFDNRKKVLDCYELIRRVRIPLAKFETPITYRNGKKEKLYKFDYGGVEAEFTDNGIAWIVSPRRYITREELALAMYRLY